MNVNIEETVKKLCKNVKFMQPLYEAIINSFEANATKVIIEFYSDFSLLNDVAPGITGFKITDNGDGFTRKNVTAFSELWTKNKISIGCKGSGRFTWLAVFSSVKIDSYLKDDLKHISFVFNNYFNDDSIQIEDFQTEENQTSIVFSGVTNKFYDANSHLDKRFECNLDLIKSDLLTNIYTKLFWMKESNRDFTIVLKYLNDELTITDDDLPLVVTERVNITSDIDDKQYNFDLHYRFIDDGNHDIQIWLCTKDRSVSKVSNSDFGLFSNLPNDMSGYFFISSDYFNDKTDDSRSDMPDFFKAKTPNLDIKIIYQQIVDVFKEKIEGIVLNKFPEVNKTNEQVIEEAKKLAPHLIPFMNFDNFVLADSKEIIKTAKKAHESLSQEYEDRMEEQLESGDVGSDSFRDAIDGVSISAAVELGRYIYSREKIIDALKKTIESETSLEKNVHDLIVPQKKILNKNAKDKIELSNLWLLDDKFMSFSLVSSDNTILKAKKETGTNSPNIGNVFDRPDLLLFFNNQENVTDFVVVELKGPNADIDELTKALTETPRNIRLVRENFKETNMAFGYIIAKITSEFVYMLETMSYKRLFTNEKQDKMFYIFNEGTSSHIYVLDYDTIVADARARNSTFLSILESTNQR